MKTSSCKAKGRNLQNFIVDELRESFNLDINEPDRYSGEVQAQVMGASGTDVKLSPVAKLLIPYDIECKNQENWSIPSWWKQTITNTEKDRKPLLIIKKNRQEPLVVLKWSDFKELL